MTRSARARTVAITALLVTAGALLTGCSAASGDKATGGIATLTTSSAAPSPSADPLIARYGEAPRLRLDMSHAEQDRAAGSFYRCSADNGGMGASDEKPTTTAGLEKSERAATLCAPLLPKPPWELDRANPDALTFMQGVIDCLKHKGVTQAEIAPDQGDGQLSVSLGGPDNDSRSISLGMRYMSACERAVSGTTR